MGLSFVTEDEPDLTLPEDTIFRARLTEIKPKEIKWVDKVTQEHKSKDMLEWWFEITSENLYKGRKVKAECPAKLSNHPGNQFRNWSQVILDREIPAGMGIDTDDLIGLACEVTIRHEKSKSDASRVFERIDEILPASGASFVEEPPF